MHYFDFLAWYIYAYVQSDVITHFIRHECFSLGLDDCRPPGETVCQDFLGILPGWEFYRGIRMTRALTSCHRDNWVHSIINSRAERTRTPVARQRKWVLNVNPAVREIYISKFENEDEAARVLKYRCLIRDHRDIARSRVR